MYMCIHICEVFQEQVNASARERKRLIYKSLAAESSCVPDLHVQVRGVIYGEGISELKSRMADFVVKYRRFIAYLSVRFVVALITSGWLKRSRVYYICICEPGEIGE